MNKRIFLTITIIPAIILCFLMSLMLAATGNYYQYYLMASVPLLLGIFLIFKSRTAAVILFLLEATIFSYQVYVDGFNKAQDANFMGLIVMPFALLAIYGTFQYHRSAGSAGD